jgi:monovalent cation:H+ antiporter, CPA1 family
LDKGSGMSVFEVSAILIVLTALFSFVNAKLIRLPTMIGVMFLSLAVSLALALTGGAAWGVKPYAARFLAHIDFNQTVLHGMLAFLLFAGSLQLQWADLNRERGAITLLAVVGTAISTLAIGAGLWLILRWAGIEVPLLGCLVFGALISPTDPVAVLGILKSAGAPRSVSTLMAGESLFNDGIGVVFFFVLMEMWTHGSTPTAWGVTRMLVWEAGGGVLLGLAAGQLTIELLRRVDQHQVEVLLTLALVMGGYVLGEAIGVSAPIAMVIAGLMIGNRGREVAMSDVTREHLDTFWEMIDEILNAVLFMLLGLEVLVMPFHVSYLGVGVAAIALCLLVRLIVVGSLIRAMRFRRSFVRGTTHILAWGGLRGALSVAMALSLQNTPNRDLILAVTYCVVVFSVLIQGLTVGPVARRICETSLEVPISNGATTVPLAPTRQGTPS